MPPPTCLSTLSWVICSFRKARPVEAIAKYSVVAQSYSARGEVLQASKLLRRIIQLSPMDLGARNRLIDQLIARGQVDDAIHEYLELAAIHYRLAELDMARKTFTIALRLVQQGNASRDWNTTSCSAWPISTCSAWIGNKPCASTNRSALSVGKKEEAMMIVNQILLLNPPNSEQYRQLLSQIQQ
jgi:tetratricopeptide (TPR) repeat protein